MSKSERQKGIAVRQLFEELGACTLPDLAVEVRTRGIITDKEFEHFGWIGLQRWCSRHLAKRDQQTDLPFAQPVSEETEDAAGAPVWKQWTHLEETEAVAVLMAKAAGIADDAKNYLAMEADFERRFGYRPDCGDAIRRGFLEEFAIEAFADPEEADADGR